MERIPCNPSPECKYYPTCYEDDDHYYWPRSEYRKPVEKQFRNLGCFITRTCRDVHDERHATEAPPPKPSRDEMLAIINRERAS